MKIIAHRANDGIHRENSLEAIINSLNKPYVDGIEIDVRLTKDKKIIINHDPFYNGNYISHTSSLKLQKMGLNTLKEVLENIKTNKIILIEIKIDNKNTKIMYKRLIKLLKKYPLNYYISSFNYEFIKYFKTKANIKCGLIISLKIGEKHINNPFDFNMINYLYNKKIPNKETFKWTINNEKQLKQIKKNENIITDRSKTIYELLKKNS